MRTKKNLGGYNPSVKEFLERKPSITLIGLLWAMYWRVVIIVWSTILIVGLLVSVIAVTISGK